MPKAARLHVVDGTFELFRAHFSPRPGHLDAKGRDRKATVGLAGSMLSLFRLRRLEPELERPFRAPFYPVFPAVALVLALFCLVAVTIYNAQIAALYGGLMLGSFVLFRIVKPGQTDAD